MATKSNIGEVVTTYARSWVQASPWGFPSGAKKGCGQTGHLQKDCKKNTAASISGQADKKPSASGRVFAITKDHATKTSGFLANIHDTTSDVPSIHDQPIVSEFPDVFPGELPG
nr:hypothetical protein [Tanacetum cinerariifolium]